MTAVSPPVFTDSVDQQFFIEAQGGPQPVVSYLDRFPDSLYSKAVDSVLVTFLYALLGPTGVGQLRKEFLEARLMIEDAALQTADLDALYTNPFAFARLAEETYQLDADASLLPSGKRAAILANDAAFRNRAIDFLKGVRAGGTLLGLTLVARSGLNRPVEVVENYRYLFDQYADRPLHLPYLGTTNAINEVIVLPRQTIPTSAKQTLVINGEPTSGWFTLSLPLGPLYQVIQIGLTGGSNLAVVPDSSQIPPGAYISITNQTTLVSSIGNATPVTYAVAGTAPSPTSIQLLYPPTAGANAGLPLAAATTGTFWAYVGQAETPPIAYNSNAITVQNALQAMRVIGPSNVAVSGGPLPDQPIVIQFQNALSERPIPTLTVSLQPSTQYVNGIGPPSSSPPLAPMMTDVTNNTINITANVTNDIAGVSADSQTTSIAPADEHAMQVALDQIRPQTVFVSTKPAQSMTQRQPANNVFAGSNYTEVVRYETGNASINWPLRDNTHWLEASREHEAPRPLDDTPFQYRGFHNVVNIYAYTEAALSDPGYATGVSAPPSGPSGPLLLLSEGSSPLGAPGNPLWATYWNTKVGPFSPAQVALYPVLATTNPHAQYTASQAVAASPDPLVITHTINGMGVIDGIYPADYLSLPGVLQLPTDGGFWASLERVPDAAGDPSIDYLEVDLGTPQAVNYIYFEATNKPYSITVDYDVLDQTPSRRFVPTTILPPSEGQSTTSLHYDATNTNPWSVVEIHCANGMGQMIFTRYLRIGFRRNPGGTPFAPLLAPPVPYSIEVRNLRIGRNVAVTSPGGSTAATSSTVSFNNQSH